MARSKTYAVATGKRAGKRGQKKLLSKNEQSARWTASALRSWGTSSGKQAPMKPFGTGTRRRGTKSRSIHAEHEVTYRAAGGRVTAYGTTKKTGRVARSGWTLAKNNVRRDKSTGQFRSR